MSKSYKSGLTLVELLISAAIIILLATLVLFFFSTTRQSKSLSVSAAQVTSLLTDARERTLSGINDTQYGVHFDSDQAVIFQGATYTAGASTNEVTVLSNLVTISGIALTGGGAEVIFDRLTGDTSESGTITLSVVGSASTKTTITISSTGVVEMH